MLSALQTLDECGVAPSVIDGHVVVHEERFCLRKSLAKMKHRLIKMFDLGFLLSMFCNQQS